MPLNLLRHMLVIKEIDESGLPSGDLLLLGGTPRRWFEDSKSISVQNAPTYFGAVSISVKPHLDKGRIEMEIDPPTRNNYRTLKVRVPHPQKKKIKKVTVNGRKYDKVDVKREIIEFTQPSRPIRIRIYF